MAVMIDMVTTVAVITIALGTIAELHIRVGYVGSSTDRTPVGVAGGGGLFLGHLHVELDYFRLFGLFAQKFAYLILPVQRDYIQYILSKEQEVISQGNQREEICRSKGWGKYTDKDGDKIDQRKDPCFDGDDEKQQEPSLGIQGGVAQKQAHIQVIYRSITAEYQAVNVHEQNPGKVKNVEFHCAPYPLHGTAQRVVAQQRNYHGKKIAAEQSEGIRDQTPYLSMQDLFSVEAKPVVQRVVSSHHTDQIDDCVAQCEIKHQVGDALIPVDIAKPFKFSA